jgi:hypothetical protein
MDGGNEQRVAIIFCFKASLSTIKLYDCAKACIRANGTYFEFSKKLFVFDLKKISPKTFRLHCVYYLLFLFKETKIIYFLGLPQFYANYV